MEPAVAPTESATAGTGCRLAGASAATRDGRRKRFRSESVRDDTPSVRQFVQLCTETRRICLTRAGCGLGAQLVRRLVTRVDLLILRGESAHRAGDSLEVIVGLATPRYARRLLECDASSQHSVGFRGASPSSLETRCDERTATCHVLPRWWDERHLTRTTQ
jgi:hypothetical protein